MERDSDLRRVLADEIRAAIAETAPDPGAVREAVDPATAAARSSLARASQVLTPSVPRGAALEPVKRLGVRALRFLWRNQSGFNSLSLDASSRLADAIERMGRQIGELARRAGVQESRLTLAEGAAPGAPTAVGVAAPDPGPHSAALPAGVYALFEERFRGSPAEVARGQRFLRRDAPGSARTGARRRVRAGRVPAAPRGRRHHGLGRRVESGDGRGLPVRGPRRRASRRARGARTEGPGIARRGRGVPGRRALAAGGHLPISPGGAPGDWRREESSSSRP